MSAVSRRADPPVIHTGTPTPDQERVAAALRKFAVSGSYFDFFDGTDTVRCSQGYNSCYITADGRVFASLAEACT